MTEEKAFKRRVRERMSKTGERYTAARGQVARKRDRERAARARLAAEDDRPSEARVREATGRSWDQWFSILDRWGATERKHPEIARYLREEKGVDGWWSQSVTVWYERARGMRLKHQRPGGFEVSASKTIAAPVEEVFEAFADEGARRRWLPDATMSLRGARPGRTARFDWEDGSSRVVVWFEDRGPSKSTVSMAHQKVPDAEEAETLKAMWRERLKALKTLLES